MEERSWLLLVLRGAVGSARITVLRLLLVLRGAVGSARITVLRQSSGGKELAIAGPQRCCWECQDHCSHSN